MGAANKVSANKITGIKVLKKKNPKPCENEVKSETFLYKGLFLHLHLHIEYIQGYF